MNWNSTTNTDPVSGWTVKIGDDPRLKAVLKQAQERPALPGARGVSDELALQIVESCRQGSAPTQGSLVLAVGREALLTSMRHDLGVVANCDSRLRVIHGALGMGKTLTLRVLQEYAHQEGFATSFLTLGPAECPMDDLTAVYRQIVKGIRVCGCSDRPALEHVLVSWAHAVKTHAVSEAQAPGILKTLDRDFLRALTEYYEGIRRARPAQSDLWLRWLSGELRSAEARRLGVGAVLSEHNALSRLGHLTRMLRFVGVKGLVILLDEADSIRALPNARRQAQAYANLIGLARSASTAPYTYFAYATTPAFLESIPAGSDDAITNLTTLCRLTFKELVELTQIILELHFKAYGWQTRSTGKQVIRDFVKGCVRARRDTPRAFVRTLIGALDICEEDEMRTLDRMREVLG